jgi:hypothetical protein
LSVVLEPLFQKKDKSMAVDFNPGYQSSASSFVAVLINSRAILGKQALLHSRTPHCRKRGIDRRTCRPPPSARLSRKRPPSLCSCCQPRSTQSLSSAGYSTSGPGNPRSHSQSNGHPACKI